MYAKAAKAGQERHIMKSNGYIIGVGAANFDISGKSLDAIKMRDSNPGRFSISSGGVTRNILENLSRLGVSTKLISAVGEDIFGDYIISGCVSAGIETALVRRVKTASSSYAALLDDSGDMLVAMSDMRILEAVTPRYLDSVADIILRSEAVVCDPGLPLASLQHLLTITSDRVPVFVDPVSTTYAEKLRDIAGEFRSIKPNRMELSIIAEIDINDEQGIENACDRLLAAGTEQIIVTLGGEGCFYKDRGGTVVRRGLHSLDRMANATGGGDAFSAAVVYGYAKDLPIGETLDLALAAGIAAVSSEHTINPDMSVDLLYDIINRYKHV